MEIVDVKKACETRLVTLTALPTAYEGVEFIPPASMYQRVQYQIFTPEDSTLPAGYHRERMQMQVFVVDVLGQGTTAALTRAGLIRDLFKRGTTIVESGTRILILNTPQVGATIIADGRLIVPVIIPLTVEVYS